MKNLHILTVALLATYQIQTADYMNEYDMMEDYNRATSAYDTNLKQENIERQMAIARQAAAEEQQSGEDEDNILKPVDLSQVAQNIKAAMIDRSITVFDSLSFMKMRQLLQQQGITSMNDAITIFDQLINDKQLLNRVSTSTNDPSAQSNLANVFTDAYNFNKPMKDMIIWSRANRKFIPYSNS